MLKHYYYSIHVAKLRVTFLVLVQIFFLRNLILFCNADKKLAVLVLRIISRKIDITVFCYYC